jgi:dienelactone hydrolase
VNIATRNLSYRDLDTSLTGLFCWNEAQEGPRPGILLIHGGAGLDAHAREQACRYAALGYTVLACDMFGDGIAGDRERVMNCLLVLRDDPDRLVRRGQAGLAALAGCPDAAGPAAAVGFCFGGMAALALARAGTNLAGPGLAGPGLAGPGLAGTALAAVVSIHGSLATSAPARPGAVTAKVLACHGAADPHVPPADVAAFAAEMNHAEADWQLVMYGRALHGFTHRHAVPGAMPGVAYDQLADERSFAAARAFLADALAHRT